MKIFFDTVRPMFRRQKLSSEQVAGLTRLVAYGRTAGYQRSHIAAALATSFHETGQRMQPVREGFCKTDQGSRDAVASLHRRGIIKRNYALPNKAGQSFYGRGDVQITWEENYRKFSLLTGLDLVGNPDLVLDPDVSAAILFIGMRDGIFRSGRSFDMLPANPTVQEWIASRDIINGDVNKNGALIARYCATFYQALGSIKTAPLPIMPRPKSDIQHIEPKKENLIWKLLKSALARFGG